MQLYLQDIALNGKIDEILTIKVPDLEEIIISFPAKKLDDLKTIKEANYSGIYFLWAKSKKEVYIGQTTNLKPRLERHYEDKDWWNRCIFVTRIGNLDAAELNYLEYMFIEKAEKIRKVLDNGTRGNRSGFIDESKKERLNSFIENVLSILQDIGIDIFLDKHKKPHRKWTEKISKEKFYLEGCGCCATIVWRKENKVIVQKNSKLADSYQEGKDELKSLTRKYSKEGFINGKIVVNDISFETLNEAATFCYRGAINVWRDLKNKECKSLDEVCKEIYGNS